MCQHTARCAARTCRLVCAGLTFLPDEINRVTTPVRIARNRTDSSVDDWPAPGLWKLNLRIPMRIATWNIQTLLRPGYEDLLSLELAKYNIAIAGLCETRWRGSGEKTVGGHHFIWSGPNDGRGLHGVALAVPSNLKSTVLSWKPISGRLLIARLNSKHGKISVIVGYAPTEVAPDNIKDAYYDQLQSILQTVPPHDLTLVLTDANATISADTRDPTLPYVTGPVFVDRATNDNGRRLVNLCREAGLSVADSWFPRKKIHHWTWISNDGVTMKAIDHILVSTRWRSFVQNCRVFRGAQLANTDHRMLVATLTLKLKRTPANKVLRHAVHALEKPTVRQHFALTISNRYAALEDNASTDWPTFRDAVTSTATDVLGSRGAAPKRPWISPQTLSIIEERRHARLNNDKQTYRRLNGARNAAIRRDQDNYWSKQAEELESASHNNNMRQMYSILRKAKAAPNQQSHLIKDSNGHLLSTKEDCLERWREHFSSLLNHPPVPDDPYLDSELNKNAAGANENCLLTPVTQDEVSSALKKMKSWKAPGICGITAEMLKAGGETMVLWLVDIINHVWVQGRLPDDWKRGIILPFWKRKGDQYVCKNHRGITLLSIPGKLFTRILLRRALPAIRGRRRVQQAGFLPNRSTTDHISALRLLIEKAREYRQDRELYIAFIDLRAAFDTVDHSSLWKILEILGTPPKILGFFRQLYTDAQSCVRASGTDSSPFTINSGVRQGCVAAPDLFNCVIDYIMERVVAGIPAVKLGAYELADLEYADDTAILQGSLQDLTRALEIFDQEAKKLGLAVNWDKTELMRVGDGPDPANITIAGEEVKFVSSFRYLGSIISNKGDLKPEINRRRALALSVMQSLSKPLWRHRHISQNTKLRIYNSCVLSVLLYGAETWAVNPTLESRIDGFDSRALRRIEGIHWTQHVSNEEVRRRTRQPPASALAAQRRVRWLGHILRSPPEHPTRAILEFDPAAAGWRRPRGAPRTRWLDVLAQDLRLVNVELTDAADLAQDRRGWRQLVNLTGSTRMDVQEP